MFCYRQGLLFTDMCDLGDCVRLLRRGKGIGRAYRRCLRWDMVRKVVSRLLDSLFTGCAEIPSPKGWVKHQPKSAVQVARIVDSQQLTGLRGYHMAYDIERSDVKEQHTRMSPPVQLPSRFYELTWGHLIRKFEGSHTLMEECDFEPGFKAKYSAKTMG
jgi:hypothetical protein